MDQWMPGPGRGAATPSGPVVAGVCTWEAAEISRDGQSESHGSDHWAVLGSHRAHEEEPGEHVNFMSSPCQFHVNFMASPHQFHVNFMVVNFTSISRWLILWPVYANFMTSPRQFYVNFISFSCQFHINFMASPRQFHDKSTSISY